MIPTTDHFIAQSLKEFLNWKTLSDLRAFKTVSGALTQYSPKWQGKSALGTPYGGMVYDQGISGATVMTGLSGVSGSYVDYRNGRFIVPTGTVYTGSLGFSINEINYYLTSSPESKLIFETKPKQNPVQRAATGYMPESSFIAPCVFVKSFSSESEDHCFGGENRLIWNFKIVCMMRTESQLLGMQKIVRDCRNDIFPMITGSLFNPYGGLTTPGWTYTGQMAGMTDYAFITNSTFKILELDVFTDDNPKMFMGVGNIEVDYHFTPEIEEEISLGNFVLVDDNQDIIGDSDDDSIFAPQ